jgi:cold shock protein
MSDSKTSGTVKTKNERRFGFISREGEAKDLFFHEKDLKGVSFDDLNEGDKVTFEVTQTEKGLNATNVEKAA